MNFLGLIALIGTIIGAAIVNAVEIAIVAANPIRVHHLAEGGSRAAQSVERLQHDHERFFAALVFLQTFFVVFAGALGASVVSTDKYGVAGSIAAVAITAFVTAEFSDLIPKVLGSRAKVGFALFVGFPAEALTRVLAPIIATMSFLPRLLSRWLFGVDMGAGPTVSEAELRMLIETSAETGTMAEEEAELLDRVFHFGDRHVHEVMTPRTEAVGVEKHATVSDFYAIYSAAPHSRFPVFDENPDKVVGILGIKDVLAALARSQVTGDSGIEPLARPAYFVPESKLIGELFREMQSRGIQMAVAVDEFGGTAGVVTLEQLLEEMVGQVWDEMRPGEVEITPIDERTIQVDGSLSVEEARNELGVDIPEGPYDTIAGYVLSRLGHIPQVGEAVALDHHRITVAEMRNLKIELLRVTKTT